MFNSVPTPVGMDRPGVEEEGRPGECPHARGDGPLDGNACVSEKPVSPRPWGWTAARQLRRHALPECPHARGDGPEGVLVAAGHPSVSPRPWGWTARGERPGHQT